LGKREDDGRMTILHLLLANDVSGNGMFPQASVSLKHPFASKVDGLLSISTLFRISFRASPLYDPPASQLHCCRNIILWAVTCKFRFVVESEREECFRFSFSKNNQPILW
jgi:hypothetical protein